MNNRIQEILNELNISSLHETVAQLIELIGIENTFKIVETYGGLELYIPKLDRQLLHVRNARIREEFNGANYAELALKYKLSENRIRSIVHKKDTKKIDENSREIQANWG